MQIPVGRTNIPIAIIGMACRLPGADNLEQYWQLLSTGGSAIAELPPERLDQELYYDPRKGTARQDLLASLARSFPTAIRSRGVPDSDPKLEAGVDNAHLLMCEVAADGLAAMPGSIPFICRCATRACTSGMPREAIWPATVHVRHLHRGSGPVSSRSARLSAICRPPNKRPMHPRA